MIVFKVIFQLKVVFENVDLSRINRDSLRSRFRTEHHIDHDANFRGQNVISRFSRSLHPIVELLVGAGIRKRQIIFSFILLWEHNH